MATGGVTASHTPIWRRTLPFALAIALTAFVLARIDRDRFVASLDRTNLLALLGLATVVTCALLVADSIASVHVYRKLAGPIALRELLVLRAASYLPGLVNHNVGQAWVTYAIARAGGVPLARVIGATLVVYATTFACVVALAASSLLIAPGRFSWLPGVLAGFAAAAAAYAVVLALRPAWLVRARFTAPLADAGVRGHALALALRIPHVAVLFAGTWVPFLLFGVEIPLGDALALVPPLMVVVALPITPQAIGTRDAFAVQLFVGYAAGTDAERAASVAAATLSWAVALTLVQVPLSLISLRLAARRTS